MPKPVKTPFNAALLLAAPTPAQIAQSRARAGLSQSAMASVLGLSGASRIGEYEIGKHQMPAALWSLWLLMCKQHPLSAALSSM